MCARLWAMMDHWRPISPVELRWRGQREQRSVRGAGEKCSVGEENGEDREERSCCGFEGGHRTAGAHGAPPGRRCRRMAATGRSAPVCGRDVASARRRKGERDVGLGHGGQAGPRERRGRGERELGRLWAAGRKGGGGPISAKMIFQISFSNKFHISVFKSHFE
jgi:hypothetical protein